MSLSDYITIICTLISLLCTAANIKIYKMNVKISKNYQGNHQKSGTNGTNIIGDNNNVR